MEEFKDKDVSTGAAAQDEPQVIADIKIHNELPMSAVEQFIEEYAHCPLCGNELQFTHVTNFTYWQVEEEAHCASCNIRTKKDQHSLQ